MTTQEQDTHVGTWVTLPNSTRRTIHFVTQYEMDVETGIPTFVCRCGVRLHTTRQPISSDRECVPCRRGVNNDLYIARKVDDQDIAHRTVRRGTEPEPLWFRMGQESSWLKAQVSTVPKSRKVLTPSGITNTWVLDLRALLDDGGPPPLTINTTQLKVLFESLKAALQRE